jgi:hypothetical protein
MLRVLMLMILPAAALVVGGCSYDWKTGKWSLIHWETTKPAAAPAQPDTAPVAGPASPAPAAAPLGGPVSPPVQATAAPRTSGGGSAEAGRRGAGEAFVDAENGAVFHALDTLAYPRQPVELVAHLRGAAGLKGIAGATIAFTRGDWVAGRITTDANGVAAMRWTPPEAGNYSFEAGIVAVPNENFRDMLGLKATLLVAARDKNAPQVVVDLDHTVVDSSFLGVMAGGGKPLADSVEVLGRVSKRYGIVYLTARADLPARKSKSALADNGYPSGPLLLSRMKDSPEGGKFKSARLAALRRDFPGLAVGIVERPSDAQAYVDNGMSAYLIPNFKENPKDMRALAAEIRALRGQGRLQVVDNWRQIEQGFFGGKQFPPEDFARQLEARAARIEAAKRGSIPANRGAGA